MVPETRIIEVHTLGLALVLELPVHKPALVPIPNLGTLAQMILAVSKLEDTPVKNTDALARVDSAVYCKILLRSRWHKRCNEDETLPSKKRTHCAAGSAAVRGLDGRCVAVDLHHAFPTYWPFLLGCMYSFHVVLLLLTA